MVFMDGKVFRIESLTRDEIERAARFFNHDRHSYDDSALRRNMETGDWTAVLAAAEGRDVGGFYLNRVPKYTPYRRLHVPELQDLRVLPGNRRLGIGTALITYAENMVRETGGKGLGISVGLYADYGPAQRLYARLGYVPDGNGVTYDRQPTTPGEKVRLDDDLALMLVKFF